MKKKIVTLSLVLALIAIIATGTLAYFTDIPEAKTNTFVIGNIDIEFDEEFDPPKSTIPGVEYEKKPWVKVYGEDIENNNGANDAYVMFSITLKEEVAKVFGIFAKGEGEATYSFKLATFQKIFKGGLVDAVKAQQSGAYASDDADVTLVVPADVDEDGNYVFYLRKNSPIEAVEDNAEERAREDNRTYAFTSFTVPETFSFDALSEDEAAALNVEVTTGTDPVSGNPTTETKAGFEVIVGAGAIQATGFEADGEEVAEADRKTAAEKAFAALIEEMNK